MLLHTLHMDKVCEGYKIYLYKEKMSDGNGCITYYQSISNHPSSRGIMYHTKEEMYKFYNEWLSELGYDTI